MIIKNHKDWIIKTKVSQEILEIFKNNVDNLVSNLNPINLEDRSPRGKLSKQYDLMKSDTSILNKHVIPFLQNHLGNFNFTNVGAWTVYGEEYGYHILHKHNEENEGDICTVTYLSVPESTFDFFGDIFFVLRDLDNKLKVERMSPEIGDMFIFPCHLLHGTTPQSKGIRQTLNLDYKPILKNNINNII